MMQGKRSFGEGAQRVVGSGKGWFDRSERANPREIPHGADFVRDEHLRLLAHADA